MTSYKINVLWIKGRGERVKADIGPQAIGFAKKKNWFDLSSSFLILFISLTVWNENLEQIILLFFTSKQDEVLLHFFVIFYDMFVCRCWI